MAKPKKKPDPYRRSLARVLQILRDALAATINGRDATAYWDELERQSADTLLWADLIAAARLRKRGLNQTTHIPDIDPTIVGVADANMWVRSHFNQSMPLVYSTAHRFTENARKYTNRTAFRFARSRVVVAGAPYGSPLSQWRAEQVAEVVAEAQRRRQMETTARFVVTGNPDIQSPIQAKMSPEQQRKLRGELVHLSKVPEYAVRRFERDSVGEVANASEQIELNDPEVGAMFPFGEYHTRDDARVRPTHARMQGFVAQRAWEGWKTIRPKCGYGCRCYPIWRTKFEAIDLGYMTAKGEAKFMEKWPNTAAKTNYETGKFPDKGWQGPKAVAAAKPLPPERTK